MNLLLYLSHQVTIQGTVAVALPAGIVADYAGGTIAPSGWLLCDGAAVSRATYAALFAAIGGTFGNGDGSTTFNVPDCRGRSAIGTGTGPGLTPRNLNDQGGEETHTLSTAELALHNHALTDPGHNHTPGDLASFLTNGASTAFDTTAPSVGNVTAATANSVTGITLAGAGGDNAHNNMHPYIALAKIISTG